MRRGFKKRKTTKTIQKEQRYTYNPRQKHYGIGKQKRPSSRHLSLINYCERTSANTLGSSYYLIGSSRHVCTNYYMPRSSPAAIRFTMKRSAPCSGLQSSNGRRQYQNSKVVQETSNLLLFYLPPIQLAPPCSFLNITHRGSLVFSTHAIKASIRIQPLRINALMLSLPLFMRVSK